MENLTLPGIEPPVVAKQLVTKNPHTLGPWHVGRSADMRSGIAMVADRFGIPICHTEPMLTDEVANGNAALIAAAPCMLALLKEIDEHGYFREEYWLKISAAIAKAEGSV